MSKITYTANYCKKLTFFLVIFFPYFLVVVTTEYISFHPVWTSGRAAGQPFVIKGTIFYPEETIMYPFQDLIFIEIHVVRAESLQLL